MSIYDKLKAMNISLQKPTTPPAAFLPYIRVGNLIHLSGHIARKNEQPWSGKVGRDMDREEAREAARAVAIDLLATLHAATGDLDQVKRIVKLLVLVNSDISFTEQHIVANGASEFLIEVFGDAGKHARSAFGVAQIPLGSCVEIELIAELA
jgi:enamine deaminase RidA (YjgF/YER057c/UK114 family)